MYKIHFFKNRLFLKIQKFNKYKSLYYDCSLLQYEIFSVSKKLKNTQIEN